MLEMVTEYYFPDSFLYLDLRNFGILPGSPALAAFLHSGKAVLLQSTLVARLPRALCLLLWHPAQMSAAAPGLASAAFSLAPSPVPTETPARAKPHVPQRSPGNVLTLHLHFYDLRFQSLWDI